MKVVWGCDGAGELLATMTLEDPSKVQTAVEFAGTVELPGNAVANETVRLSDALENLSFVLDGYHASDYSTSKSLASLRQSLGDAMLPVLQLEDLLGRLKNAMCRHVRQAEGAHCICRRGAR